MGDGKRSSVRRAIASMSSGVGDSAGQALGGGHGRGTRGGAELRGNLARARALEAPFQMGRAFQRDAERWPSGRRRSPGK